MSSRPLKILLLTDSDVFAGTERHLLDLARALGPLDCEVSIGCPEKGILADRARACGVRVFPVEKRGLIDLRAIFRLWSASRRGQFDLVHAHNGRTALLAALATRFSRGARLVTTQHFLSPAHTALRGIKARVFRGLHRWVATRAARIVAISGAVRDAMTVRHAAPPDKIRVVLNGVPDPQKTGIASRETIRGAFGISPDAPLIVVSARLDPEKGLDTLIHAMGGVLTQIPSAQCLVAGEGASRSSLQSLLNEKGIARSMRLIGFYADIFSLIAAADMFVLPSPDEPFGLALIEAMGLERPVVAGRAGGPLEIIVAGESGLLFEPRDSADLASCIVRVLGQRDLAARLGSNARQRYLERFTSERMAAEMLSVYRETMSQP